MGNQLSAAWMVVQAAESLAISNSQEERRAGKALRCCEVTSLKKVTREEQEGGLKVSLRFYDNNDLKIVKKYLSRVANRIASTFGLQSGDVQIHLGLISSLKFYNPDSRIRTSRPPQRGGSGRRLDYHLSNTVLKKIKKEGDKSARRHLEKREGQVRILLRRLRYRFVQDYRGKNGEKIYAYWSSQTTQQWAKKEKHDLQEIIQKLTRYSDELKFGYARPAESLNNIAYSSEIDTEQDRLVVAQLTTKYGATRDDVEKVLRRADSQIALGEVVTINVDEETHKTEPLTPFIEELEAILDHDHPLLDETDILIIHRGGGVNPRRRTGSKNTSNVNNEQRKKLLDLCEEIRNEGIEVIVAIGHANISVLKRDNKGNLPLGIFEATTPTAGASWILQEHINPRLVDDYLLYRQNSAT